MKLGKHLEHTFDEAEGAVGLSLKKGGLVGIFYNCSTTAWKEVGVIWGFVSCLREQVCLFMKQRGNVGSKSLDAKI